MSGVLTIAGSDSGGGAGIQADLKTMTLLGGHGMSVITAVTAQNSSGVRGTYAIPLPMIESQIDAIFSDMKVDAVKTGMLSDADVVGMVAQKMNHYQVEKLVVDPVMVAKDGSALLSEEGQDAVKRTLLPCAFLVTPNIPEASVLTGLAVTTVEGMRDAARRIYDMGPRAVLVKGGHLAGDPVDILFDGSSFNTFTCARIGRQEVHGTGCVLSAAISTYLSVGFPLADAVEKAIRFLRAGINVAMTPGQGRPFVNFAAMALRGDFR